MELGADRSLNTMDRPWSTLRLERTMVRGMPVPGGVYLEAIFHEGLDIVVQNGDHPVPFRHGQCSSGTEIVLHIRHDQGSLPVGLEWVQMFHRTKILSCNDLGHKSVTMIFELWPGASSPARALLRLRCSQALGSRPPQHRSHGCGGLRHGRFTALASRQYVMIFNLFVSVCRKPAAVRLQ